MKTCYSFFIFIILIACNTKKDNSEPAVITPPDLPPIPYDSSTAIAANNPVPVEKYYAWDVDFEAQTKRRNPELTRDSLSADSIISWLNKTHPNIQLHKTGIKKDTIILEIPDSEYLTQRMGSTGPAEYLSKVVLNLTAVTGINFVRLNFEEGDHATPGVWSKKVYSDFKTVQ